MAEKEETITVAVRLPVSEVQYLRTVVEASDVRNMSELLRLIVAEWMAGNNA